MGPKAILDVSEKKKSPVYRDSNDVASIPANR